MPKKSTAAPRGPGQPRKYTAGVVTLLLRLPADLAEAVREKARALGMKRTAALQQAVREWTRRKS
jgi:hypothetical protein